jgi:hypothetical protein
MRCVYAHDAWYFRQGAQIRGPVTAKQLTTLVADGWLDARQIVWARRDRDLLFMRAEAVAPPHNSSAGSAVEIRGQCAACAGRSGRVIVIS